MEATNIITFLLSSTKSIEEWLSLQSNPDFFNDLETVLRFLIHELNDGMDHATYLNYLLTLNIEQFNEDQLTSYYELLILEINYNDLNKQWFCDLLANNLVKEKSGIILENVLIFLSERHQKDRFNTQDKLIQVLQNKIENPVFNNMLKLFLFENSLQDFSEYELLQLFDSLSHKSRLDLLAIVNDKSPDIRNAFMKRLILRIKKNKFSEVLTNLAIIFNCLDIVQELFSDFHSFCSFIISFQTPDYLEPLIYEIVKPKWLANPWVIKLIEFFLEEQNSIDIKIFIVKASGEYLVAFPDNLVKNIVDLSRSSNKEILEELTGIISELWHNEKLILNLLESREEVVRTSLFQSVIPIFPSLSSSVQRKLQEYFSESNYLTYKGYLHGYHYEDPVINKNNLIELFERSSEDVQSGIVLGLSMRWNGLDTNFRTFLLDLLDNSQITLKVKQYLCNGLESFIGLLDEEGLEILKKGQKNYFSGMTNPDKANTDDVVLL